jgi:predicted MFS family arabinose efflux permease
VRSGPPQQRLRLRLLTRRRVAPSAVVPPAAPKGFAVNVKRLILVLGLAGFIVMADNWVVSPLLPTIARDFSMDPARAGVLIAAYMLPFGLFQLVYGPLADRFGKLRVVIVSLALFTVATALCATASGIHDLTAFRALTGIFAAATMPVSLALIGDLVPMQDRQRAIATFMGIAFLGQATSMTIGSTIAAVSDWRGVFVVYAIVAVVIVAALYLSTRSIRDQLKGDPHSQFLRPYGRLLAHGPSLRTYLLVFVEGVLILGSFSYAGAYAAKALGLETFGIGLLMAVFGVGVIAGSRFSSRLAGRLGRPGLVALGLGSAALADLLLASLGSHIGVFAIAILLLGLGFMFAHSSLLTIVTGFAERARGAAMSLIAFAFMVGGSGGTMLGGRIILGAGYTTLYLGFGVALAALGVVALVALPSAQPQQVGPMAGGTRLDEA